MDINTTKDIEQLKLLVGVGDGLYSARQIAYEAAKKNPFFEDWYKEADDVYVRYCARIGSEPKPVFDAESHERMRIAQGHPDYFDTGSTLIAPSHDDTVAGDWAVHGSIDDYIIWHNGEVYQINRGHEPSNQAGYRSLEALLRLKGLDIRNLVEESGAYRP